MAVQRIDKVLAAMGLCSRKEAAGYAQTGNKEALKELADEKLTAQEKAELKEIYEKYVNQQNAESGQTA